MTQTKSDPGKEVSEEVSAEMIEAGYDVLANCVEDYDDKFSLARKVYIAMQRRRSPPADSREREEQENYHQGPGMSEELKPISRTTRMTDSNVLLELADRCEREPSRDLDDAIHSAVFWVGDPQFSPNFTTSLDAAITLVPEHWFWRCGYTPIFNGWAHVSRTHADHCDRKDEHSSTKASNPVLALCAAALRAHASLVAPR